MWVTSQVTLFGAEIGSISVVGRELGRTEEINALVAEFLPLFPTLRVGDRTVTGIMTGEASTSCEIEGTVQLDNSGRGASVTLHVNVELVRVDPDDLAIVKNSNFPIKIDRDGKTYEGVEMPPFDKTIRQVRIRLPMLGHRRLRCRWTLCIVTFKVFR